MQITCPKCHKMFSVSDNAIPLEGRQVKCSSCQHIWLAHPNTSIESEGTKKNTLKEEKNISEALDDLSPFSKPLQRQKLHAHKSIKQYGFFQRLKKFLITFFLWIITIGILVGSGYSLYLYRGKIIAWYPPAANVYQQLGLWKIPGYGLQISIPTTEAKRKGKNIVLTITGTILNNNKNKTEVPLLEGSLQDSSGKTLYSWTFKADENTVSSLGIITYHTAIENPPDNTKTLSIAFKSTNNNNDFVQKVKN